MPAHGIDMHFLIKIIESRSKLNICSYDLLYPDTHTASLDHLHGLLCLFVSDLKVPTPVLSPCHSKRSKIGAEVK